MRITVDPNTDSSGFDYVSEGQYRLRVVKVEQKQKQGGDYPYLNWSFEFADPNVLGVKGKKPGNVFEITTLKPGSNSQFRLKQLCDALGLTWGDFDTDETIGMEFDAILGIKDYEGTLSNEVTKKGYIPA
jgi:hypothetical protein